MLYRKAQIKLEEWINDGKDALLITGARQVGKTYLIRETLKKNKKDYVEFNLIDQKELVSVFDNAIQQDANKFLMALRVASKRVLNNETVIFIDEVQECKEIVTIIKFLVEKGQYRYILSGSLLGVELVDLRSAPVGYLSTIDMYPLDLEEFLIANGLGKDVIKSLHESFVKQTSVADYIHNQLIEAFYRYVIVGGMPEAVQTYVNTGDFNLVSEVHRKIYQAYKRDFTKYEKNQKLKLINTYDLIPSELNAKNKRYIFTNLNKQLRFDKYENSFEWLKEAGVALPVYNVTEATIPLEASKQSNLFKLFLSDVGMLTTVYGSSTILKLLEKNKGINCGAMFENVIAQELKAHGFNLFYFNNKKHGELDLLIDYEGMVTPLEIKSGKDYKTHSALTYFMENQKFKRAYVLSNYNLSTKNNITYLPIYMIMFIQNNFQIDRVEKLNLGNL